MQKILVVDDDELVRNLVQEKLADCYEIVETGDPEQALGLALQHKPAAILLDLMMPSFSGFQICENLRSCSYTSRIPIFVISGQSAGSYQELCETMQRDGNARCEFDFRGVRDWDERSICRNSSHRTSAVFGNNSPAVRICVLTNYPRLDLAAVVIDVRRQQRGLA